MYNVYLKLSEVTDHEDSKNIVLNLLVKNELTNSFLRINKYGCTELNLANFINELTFNSDYKCKIEHTNSVDSITELSELIKRIFIKFDEHLEFDECFEKIRIVK